MIRLTVDNKDIVLPAGATISIEKNSPVLNVEVGAFSYPFPVPTSKNRQALSYPGRLERAKDIPVKSFVLEENGTRILTGEVEIDQAEMDETGLILQSGNTEFTKRMKDKYLGDIDFGHEEWPVGTTAIIEKLSYWDDANTTDNGKYVAAPYIISPILDYTSPIIGNGITTVNQQLKINGQSESTIDLFSGNELRRGFYSLQFKISFVLRTIYLKAGYSIKEDQFLTSEFNKSILFGNILELEGDSGSYEVPESLEYSALMPKLKVLDFIKIVSDLFCIVCDVNELRKEVHISFKKDIFLGENLSTLKLTELTGWQHKEHRPVEGFSLSYSSQENDLDTESDYEIGEYNLYVLPEVGEEGSTVRVISGVTPQEYAAGMPYYYRDYIVVKNDSEVLEWKEIGRLKEYSEGNGEHNIDIDINIPYQKINTFKPPLTETYECPALYGASYSGKTRIKTTSSAYISLYHGRKTFSGCQVPYTSFDRYSLDYSIDTDMSLKPSYMYEKVYKEFINWQAFRARECTKYLKLTLSEVISLEWRKRYPISGVPILLEQVSFEIPYTGIVKIHGFTA